MQKNFLSNLINNIINWNNTILNLRWQSNEKNITVNWKTCSFTVLKQLDLLSTLKKKQFDLLSSIKKCEKSRDVQHVKKYQLPIFILIQNWKLNIAIAKIVAKKKKTIDLMLIKSKVPFSKRSKEHRIRFRNNHNHVMLIIQKSVFLLNWFESSSINWYLLPLYVM